MSPSPEPAPDPITAPVTEPDAVPPGAIAVGVDGSEQGGLALTWAADQARREARPLVLVHGSGSGHTWWIDVAGAGPEVNDLQRQAALEAGRTLLEQTHLGLGTSHPGLEVHSLLVPADARQVLLDVSRTARMIVVGSRGQGPVARLVMGSVSAAVTRHATCPVIVVRPRDPATAPRGILVGVDRGERSRAALEFAFDQAALRDLPLTVTYCSFSVVGAGEVRELPYDIPGYDEERRILEEAVDGLPAAYPGVALTLTLGSGLVDSYLIDAARRSEMVVVGAHADRYPWDHLFDRNVDRSVVLHAPAIVAIVPEKSV